MEANEPRRNERHIFGLALALTPIVLGCWRKHEPVYHIFWVFWVILRSHFPENLKTAYSFEIVMTILNELMRFFARKTNNSQVPIMSL